MRKHEEFNLRAKCVNERIWELIFIGELFTKNRDILCIELCLCIGRKMNKNDKNHFVPLYYWTCIIYFLIVLKTSNAPYTNKNIIYPLIKVCVK